MYETQTFFTEIWDWTNDPPSDHINDCNIRKGIPDREQTRMDSLEEITRFRYDDFINFEEIENISFLKI